MGRGRKPKIPKNAETSQQGTVIPSVEVTEVDTAIKTSSTAALREKLDSSIPTQEAQKANHSKVHSKSTAKKAPISVRRSGRFHKAVMATENHCIEQIIQEITVSDSEKEDEPANEELPEPSMEGKDVHEKIDYIIEHLLAQQRFMNKLNARINGKNLFAESTSAGEVTYKALYFDSQKKIEALMEENSQLSKKLEYANGKIEVYEKGDHVSYDMLEKVKDMLFYVNSSTTIAAEGALECKASKRKRAPN